MTKILALIFINFFLLACLPEAPTPAPLDEQNNNAGNVNPEEEVAVGDTTVFQDRINWIDQGITTAALTIDANNSRIISFVGDEVHNYLGSNLNFNATYCLETRFAQNGSTVPKRLRVKVVPAISTSFQIGKNTRYFRINLNSEVGNDLCNKSSEEVVNGVVKTILPFDSDYSGNIAIEANDITNVYAPQDVCVGCLNITSSSSVILYKLDTTTDILKRVLTSDIKYNDLVLRINQNSNTNQVGGSCTDNNCQQSGFDCCIEGQCVNEASVKISGVNLNQAAFDIAEREKFTDSKWYLKYPQFYNICLEQSPDDDIDIPDETDDPDGDANTRLNENIQDFKCITELEENAPSSPFHGKPLSSTHNYTACNTVDTSNTLHFENVLRRLYENCGCAEKDDLSLMIANCAAYSYTALYQLDTNGEETEEIKSIECKNPDPQTLPTPFQNLSVNVNSRTAPHRFFDSTGLELNIDNGIPGSSTKEQEGDVFRYLDPDKVFPFNGSFNMNSILGQMDVELTQARPAKIIDLEANKKYIIATKVGNYSPCPSCAKDPWNALFRANANGTLGVGLQAIGHTTRRDRLETNTTLGSYADTHFGRACFVPPTMLPYSHNENVSVQAQRLNRLETQAALFANGYQRDWYGFNKGALIGSFDGVTWFAVGKGRIVTSKSNKLFLAINAPFADLASPSDHIVSVREYNFLSNAATVDYDPDLETNDPSQNEAGSCQEYHECETDSHCITKLGWEYTCSDISYSQTKWPSFSTLEAEEKANESQSLALNGILQQASLPASLTNKRCVYRGAGAPCRVDSYNITDEGLRKSLTCAPNFYCANVAQAGVFNDQVARFASNLDEIVETKNHLFGFDANILGRPKDYIGAGNLATLPQNIQDTIIKNVQLMDPSVGLNVGLCRPGKALPSYQSSTETSGWEQATQHGSADTLRRTDYISGIAGCNSALYTDLRYSSCPMLDEDGNYIHIQDNYLNDNFLINGEGSAQDKKTVTKKYSFEQNSCGLEALSPAANITTSSTSESLRDFSAFKTIEGRSLATSFTVTEPSLAVDACLRKPGAVCHTDLDCSPNRLIAENIGLAPASFFGNLAEKKYYEEYLVCGQASAKPRLGEDEFLTYNIHNNKCCREVGSTLTMFTEDSPNAVTETTGLRTDMFGSLNPTDSRRYSRYSVEGSSIDGNSKLSSLIRPSANTNTANPANITVPNQWKTIHNTAARTCCGGSWVRKFADGTNNWSLQKEKLKINVSDLSCINLRSPLLNTEDAVDFGLDLDQLSSGRADFCSDPNRNRGGCIEQTILPMNDFEIKKPVLNTVQVQMRINSDKNIMTLDWDENLWSFHKLIPADDVVTDVDATNLVLDWTQGNSDADIERKSLVTILPSYIPGNNFDVILESPSAPNVFDTTDPNVSICGAGTAAACGSQCCFEFNATTRELKVHPNSGDRGNGAFYGSNGAVLSAEIRFTAPGTLAWELLNPGAGITDNTVSHHRRSADAGNALYYLKRLSKLEYTGIPQMTYEPIYCNDNYQKLVPGIFDEAIKTVNDFINSPDTFIDAGADTPWESDTAPSLNANSLNTRVVASQSLLENADDPIFSDNEFKCCLELGSKTNNGALCCSGFAIDEDGNTFQPGSQSRELTCKLPNETSLNVYFNKFVSGEGLNEFPGGSPLVNDDFDPRTGEPKTNAAVINKLINLGNTFCESGKTIRGGIFGNFQAKPYGPLRQPTPSGQTDTLYTIVDDVFDNGNINDRQTGYQVIEAGHKWNHHVYCDGITQN